MVVSLQSPVGEVFPDWVLGLITLSWGAIPRFPTRTMVMQAPSPRLAALATRRSKGTCLSEERG